MRVMQMLAAGAIGLHSMFGTDDRPKDRWHRAHAARKAAKERAHLAPDGTGNRCTGPERKAKCPRRGRLYWSAKR